MQKRYFISIFYFQNKILIWNDNFEMKGTIFQKKKFRFEIKLSFFQKWNERNPKNVEIQKPLNCSSLQKATFWGVLAP